MKTLAGTHGLAGWQWLFLLEGLPAVVIGFATLIYLDDGPKTAKWLSQRDRELVLTNLMGDQKAKDSMAGHHGFLPSLRDYRVWVLTLVYFCFALGVYSVTLWLPQSLRDTGVKDIVTIGFLSAIPYAVAGVAMLANGKHSDATMERRWHVATPAILAGIGLALGANSAGSLAIVLVAFSWRWGPSRYVRVLVAPHRFSFRHSRRDRIALINPSATWAASRTLYHRLVEDHLGSQSVGLYIVAAFLSAPAR
jgi:sugar phosphate permease